MKTRREDTVLWQHFALSNAMALSCLRSQPRKARLFWSHAYLRLWKPQKKATFLKSGDVRGRALQLWAKPRGLSCAYVNLPKAGNMWSAAPGSAGAAVKGEPKLAMPNLTNRCEMAEYLPCNVLHMFARTCCLLELQRYCTCKL